MGKLPGQCCPSAKELPCPPLPLGSSFHAPAVVMVTLCVYACILKTHCRLLNDLASIIVQSQNWMIYLLISWWFQCLILLSRKPQTWNLKKKRRKDLTRKVPSFSHFLLPLHLPLPLYVLFDFTSYFHLARGYITDTSMSLDFAIKSAFFFCFTSCRQDTASSVWVKQ